MEREKNVVEKANSMKEKIPEKYGLDVLQMDELYRDAQKSGGWFTLISNSFSFGYMQGMKAAKAQMKGGAR